ncbi:MAG: helix-turn-helix domain containing protein [Deltaproteobacteria bacterium]|nr:helix-turn-helix domain containing protein [Deltaproteobacteria bacterium]
MADPEFLRSQRTFNPRSEKVRAPRFSEPDQSFFDSRDKAQVKYEMLRSALVDHQPVATVAEEHGFSRIRFYQVKAQFEQRGIGGLIDDVPGPKRSRKLTPEISEFIHHQKRLNPKLSGAKIMDLVARTFGLKVSKRTVEREIARMNTHIKKNG